MTMLMYTKYSVIHTVEKPTIHVPAFCNRSSEYKYSTPDNSELNGNSLQFVSQTRKRIVQGSRPAGSIRGAPEPRRDVFIYRVAFETTADMMRRHINDVGVTIDSIDCVSNPHANTSHLK